MCLSQIRKKSCLALFYLLLFQGAFTQDSTAKKYINTVTYSVGIGTAKYFSGLSAGLGYEAHFKKYFVLASFNYLLEFQIFPQKLQNAIDLSFTLNRSFTVKPVTFAAGAGIAAAYQSLRTVNFLRLAPGSSIPDEYAFVKKITVGFPVDIQLMVQIYRFSMGVVSHSNFNSINSIHWFYFRAGVAF